MRRRKISKWVLSVMLIFTMTVSIFSAAFAAEPANLGSTAYSPAEPAGTNRAQYEIRFALPGEITEEEAKEITLSNPVRAVSGTLIAAIPEPTWEGHVFTGWYYDTKLTSPADIYDAIERNMTLYPSFTDAFNYDDEFRIDFISDQDVDPEFEIRIVAYGMSADQIRGRLSVSDRSKAGEAAGFVLESFDPDKKEQTAPDMNGISPSYYVIRPADGGWNAGDLYEVRISDTAKIRFLRNGDVSGIYVSEYNFTVHEDEYNNMRLKSSVIFLPAGEVKGAAPDGGLIGTETASGSLTYEGGEFIQPGSIIAVYEGTLNEDRTVNGSVGYFRITQDLGDGEYAYESADFTDVIFLPDIIPIKDDGTFNDGEILIPADRLNISGEPYETMGLNNNTVIEAGDFLAVYTGTIVDPNSMDPVGFGLITDVTDNNSGLLIHYDTVSEEELLKSADMYMKTDGLEISLSEKELDLIKQQISTDLKESGFAEDIASYIIGLIKNNEDMLPDSRYADPVKDMKFQREDGTEITLEELQRLAGNGEVTMDETSIVCNADQALQHYKGSGIRLNADVSAAVLIETVNGEKISVRAEGTFELEARLSLAESFKVVWKYVCGFIPYVYDVEGKIGLYADIYMGTDSAITVLTLEKEEKTSEKETVEIIGLDNTENTGSDVPYVSVSEKIADITLPADPFHILDLSLGIEAFAEFKSDLLTGGTVTGGITRLFSSRFTVIHPDSGSAVDDLEVSDLLVDDQLSGMTEIKAGFGFDLDVGITSSGIPGMSITADTGIYMEQYGFCDVNCKWTEDEENVNEVGGSAMLRLGSYLDYERNVPGNDGSIYKAAEIKDLRSPMLAIGDEYTALDFRISDYDESLTVDITQGHSAAVPNELFMIKMLDIRTGNTQTANMDDTAAVNNNGRTLKVNDKNYAQYDETYFHVEYKPLGRYFGAASREDAAKGGFVYDPATNTVTAIPSGPATDELWGEFTFTWYQGGSSNTASQLNYAAGFGRDPKVISRTVKVHWDGNSLTKWVVYDVDDSKYTELTSGWTRLNGKKVLENLPAEVKLLLNDQKYTYFYSRIFETDLNKVIAGAANWEKVSDTTVFYPYDTTYILHRMKTYVYVTWVYDDGEVVTSNWLGDKLAEPKPATRKGYDFTHWADEKGNTYEYPPAGGVKLYPQFIVHEHVWDDGVATTPATCIDEGIMTYTCTKCKETRTEVIPVDPENHTGNTEIRDAKEATCIEDGYTGDTYCVDCGKEVKTGEVITDGPHTPGEIVIENEVPSTCTEEGSYDEVVYCVLCGEEISRETKPIEKLPHTPGEPVTENWVDSTCSQEGSYDEVYYCQICGAEISRESMPVAKLPHTPGEEVTENVIPATCSYEGSYDLATYCQICGSEVGRATYITEKIPHTSAEFTTEPQASYGYNEKGEYVCINWTAGTKGEYCTVCGATISQETVKIVPYIYLEVPEDEKKEEEKKEENEKDKEERVTEFTYDDKEILKNYTTVSDLLKKFNKEYDMFAYYSSTGKLDSQDYFWVDGEFECKEETDGNKKLADYLSAGSLKVEIKFIPKDKDNYEEVEKLELTIKIYPIPE